MVKAEITVGTCYGDVIIPVEVLGKGPRPGTAWVRALNGLEPFTKISHGGPFQDSTSIVLIPHLREVHIENDPAKIERRNCSRKTASKFNYPISEKSISVEDRNIPVEDWFLESAYEDRTFIE